MELDYPDFDKPWWPDSLIKEATCGGKLYFCSGDISTYMIYYMYATFFNKDLAESYGIESPYQMVRNGSWTLDKMIEICSGVYNDLNGDGKKGIDDQFGFTTQRIFTDNFFFASGLRTTIPGDEGLPVLSPEFGGEKTQALVEKLVSAFKMEGLYNHDDSGTAHIPFAEGRAVFLMHEVQTAEIRLRTSDINYGIIPSPKYDEAQSDYYGVTSFPYTLYGIPIDAPDPQQSGIVLEALASESYRTVSPALFETALKVKYASDEDMSEMYDIIRRNNVFDIGFEKDGAANIRPYICPCGHSVFEKNIVYSSVRGGIGDDGTADGNSDAGRVMLTIGDDSNGTGTSAFDSLDVMDRNVYYIAEGMALFSVNGRTLTLDEWKSCPENRNGYDASSVSADPLFADPAGRDYRISDDSPARALGIEPIDASEIGLTDAFPF